LEKVKMLDIEDSMLTGLKSADFEGFVKVGMEYADMVVKSNDDNFSDNINALFNDFTKTRQVSADTDENFLDSYYNLYNELAN
jgi:starch synthase